MSLKHNTLVLLSLFLGPLSYILADDNHRLLLLESGPGSLVSVAKFGHFELTAGLES